MTDRVYTCADFFCGAGGMVGGYGAARAEMAGVRARFRTILAVDAWPVAAGWDVRLHGLTLDEAQALGEDAR